MIVPRLAFGPPHTLKHYSEYSDNDMEIFRGKGKRLLFKLTIRKCAPAFRFVQVYILSTVTDNCTS